MCIIVQICTTSFLMLQLILLLKTSTVSINGAKSVIAYSYDSVQQIQTNQIFEDIESDYFLARDADQYLHGKVIIVGLYKPEGGIVGVVYSAGNLQIEACNISFRTSNSIQVLEIAHVAQSIIMLGSFIIIDGQSSVNLKEFDFQLEDSEVECQ